MAERNLLCIEPDSDTVAEIRNALSPYGFGVESIPNGEEAIEWGRSHPTSLIILSVEPRKVGYAICNKIKRSPSLREIPLILISSEETLATFEQHKKLKAHADEYLLKPLDIEELLAKVNNLVPLGEKHGRRGDPRGRLGRHHHRDEEPRAAAAPRAPPRTTTTARTCRPRSRRRPRIWKAADGRCAVGHRRSRRAGAAGEPRAVAVPGRDLRLRDPGRLRRAGGRRPRGGGEAAPEGGDMVDLRSLWSDEDLPPSLGWEAPPKTIATPADHDVFRPSTLADNDGIEPADDDEDDHPVTVAARCR